MLLAAPPGGAGGHAYDLAAQLAREPGNDSVRLELAEADLARGARLEALANLRRVAESGDAALRERGRKLLVGIFRDEARAHARQGDEARARRWLAEARRAGYSGPDSDFLPAPKPEIAAALAEARRAIDGGRAAAALAILARLDGPLPAAAYALRAEAGLARARATDAEQDLYRAAAIDATDPGIARAKQRRALARARSLAADGRTREAFAALEDADSSRLEVMLLRAELDLSASDTRAALAEYDAVSKRADAPAWIAATIARLYIALGMDEELLDRFGRWDLAPKDPARLARMGRARLDRGDTARASECFRRALELDPKLVEAWSAMGRIRFTEKNFAMAAFNFDKARSCGDAAALPMLLDALERAKKPDPLAKELDRIVSDASAGDAALANARTIAQRAGLGAILARLEREEMRRRGDRDGLARLDADAFEKAGRPRDALAALRSLASPDSDEALRVVRLALACGDETAALDGLDRVPARDRVTIESAAALPPRVLLALARREANAASPSLAVTLFTRAGRGGAAFTADDHRAFIAALRSLGDTVRAGRAVRQAAAKFPTEPEWKPAPPAPPPVPPAREEPIAASSPRPAAPPPSIVSLASTPTVETHLAVATIPAAARSDTFNSRILRALERLREGLDVETQELRALANDPSSAASLALRGAIALRRRELDTAIRCGRRAVVLEPFNAEARLVLAEAFWRSARFGEAMSVLEPVRSILTSGPLRARVLAAQGAAALSLGLLDRARSILSEAYSSQLNSPDTDRLARLALDLAIAMKRSGHPDDAIEILNRHELRTLEANLVRAAALDMTGRTNDAVTLLEAAAAVSPVAALNYGILLRKNGMLPESVRVLTELEESWKDEALVAYQLAKSLEATRNLDAAKDYYRSAADLEHDSALADVFRKEAQRLESGG